MQARAGQGWEPMEEARRESLGIRFERVSGHAAAWRRLLTTRNFGWLWSGQVISQIGDGLTKVALLFFVYDLTGSALKMTVIGVLQTIPPLLFGPSQVSISIVYRSGQP